jgi:membrane-associated phospholipid phosphatase
MSTNSSQPTDTTSTGSTSATPGTLPVKLPEILVVNEAQRIAAQTAYSGRHAVSRGRVLMIFYLWLLSGAVILSWVAQRTQFFPGDRSITARLQRYRQPWIRGFFFGVSEIGFLKWATPLTVAVAGVFWALRFRLEAIFILFTSSSALLNQIVKRVIKRPRPTKDLVTVARVIDEPSFPSGHVMYYTNFFGLLIYLLATNWRPSRLRNSLISVCTALIAFIGPSRVYLGAHWPSDVMAGYVYGGLWFGGIMAFYLRVKAWIHPPRGKTPQVVQGLKQPGKQEDEEDKD